MSGISYQSQAARQSGAAVRAGRRRSRGWGRVCCPLGPPERAAEAIGNDLVGILAGLDGVAESEANRTLSLLRPGTLLTLQSSGIIETEPRIVGGGRTGLLDRGFGWRVIHWSAQQTQAELGLRPAEDVQAFLRATASRIGD